LAQAGLRFGRRLRAGAHIRVVESHALRSASRRGRESGGQRYRRRTRGVGSRSLEPFA
jgi:hypothetical protein